ncbi:hydroxymethylglutaryl-CoA lyase [Brevibacillus sp. TJ4]|uniref:hydroxymethylglutaryl-CoA lyase n=1 Tax=Brevibacillus sp. TJ4 TaxID=3234853 RepID=UPI003B9EB53B
MKLTPRKVQIREVGPRDGLQNEATFLATEHKIAWINQLSQTGLSYIEATSFVHPAWIPALADADQVMSGIDRVPGVAYAALVPNIRGLQRALAANVDEVAIFLSASESHSQKNINKSIEETLEVLEETATAALAAGKTVRGYVSTVFGCPYEGEVKLDAVLHVTEKLFEMGVREVSLGDTIGIAHPRQVAEVLDEMLKRYPAERLALHFHDTRGLAMANTLLALEMGISTFDSALGGLGGCPYAPGASGNLATDDLLFMLDRLGMETGIDQEKLRASARFLEEKWGRKLMSHQMQIC